MSFVAQQNDLEFNDPDVAMRSKAVAYAGDAYCVRLTKIVSSTSEQININ